MTDPTEERCICRNVHVGNEIVGKNAADDCPLHGFGTEWRKERSAFWNRRLREIRKGRS